MKRPFECVSVAEFLANEMSRRKRRNDAYSLRAFARDLEISPSRLSELMSAGKGLSEAMAVKIATNLGLKEREKDFFRDLVLATTARNSEVRELARTRVEGYRTKDNSRLIREDQFRVISDWYHAAILELTQLPDFQNDGDWIAKRLGITPTQALAALERLEQLELLSFSPDGRPVVNDEAYSVFSETPSTAIRKFHRQILGMAIDSVLEDDKEDRVLRAMILAIPKSRLPDFREQMTEFLEKFWKNVAHEPKDELYALSVQLCPVRNRRRTGA